VLLTEINELRNVASFWLYSANILAMHGPVNVELKDSVLPMVSVREITHINLSLHIYCTHSLYNPVES
jgi:hypothetical protein